VEDVEPVEEVERRLSHLALPPRFVEEERGGDADVERLDAPELRDRDRDVAARRTSGAGPSLPRRARRRCRRRGRPSTSGARLADRACDPEVAALDLREIAREVRDDRNGTCSTRRRRHGTRRGHMRRAVGGHDHSAGARSLRAAQNRTEVARVETWSRHARSGARPRRARSVGVAERLAPRDDALVVARAGGLERSARASSGRAASRLAQPLLRLERVLAAQSSSTSRGPRSASRTGRRP
jgi:hypothetical protein